MVLIVETISIMVSHYPAEIAIQGQLNEFGGPR